MNYRIIRYSILVFAALFMVAMSVDAAPEGATHTPGSVTTAEKQEFSGLMILTVGIMAIVTVIAGLLHPVIGGVAGLVCGLGFGWYVYGLWTLDTGLWAASGMVLGLIVSTKGRSTAVNDLVDFDE
jgi:hypothetical protein